MQNKPQKSRFLAIDYGLRRIGVALSDELKMIATPWKVLLADHKIAHAVKIVKEEITLIEKEKGCVIEKVIIGMPLKMSGEVGLQADDVKEFSEELKKTISSEIILWDERLTTVQADRMLRETDMSRKKRANVVDLVAATIILQSYLDFGTRTV